MRTVLQQCKLRSHTLAVCPSSINELNISRRIPATRTHSALNADVQTYLKDSLGLNTQNGRLDLPESLTLDRDVVPCVELLLGLNSRQRVMLLLQAHPELLGVPLDAWLNFLLAYGMTKSDFFKLLSSNPELFINGSLFNAGQTIMYLQSVIGLTNRDIRYAACKPMHSLPMHTGESMDCHVSMCMVRWVDMT